MVSDVHFEKAKYVLANISEFLTALSDKNSPNEFYQPQSGRSELYEIELVHEDVHLGLVSTEVNASGGVTFRKNKNGEWKVTDLW